MLTSLSFNNSFEKPMISDIFQESTIKTYCSDKIPRCITLVNLKKESSLLERNKISKIGQRPMLSHANADCSSHTNEHRVEDMRASKLEQDGLFYSVFEMFFFLSQRNKHQVIASM